jgi:hypothetical protein
MIDAANLDLRMALRHDDLLQAQSCRPGHWAGLRWDVCTVIPAEAGIQVWQVEANLGSDFRRDDIFR